MKTDHLLQSIQVGKPRDYGTSDAVHRHDRPWRTGIYKDPVPGPRWLGHTNLAGDGQDLRVHGGPDKAVCVYPAARYPYWEHELGLGSLPPGAFGENFTVDGVDEMSVCVGDVYLIGDATVQVSQPRGPCWKLARRWQIKDLAVRFQRTGYTGWYLRVVAEGLVRAGPTHSGASPVPTTSTTTNATTTTQQPAWRHATPWRVAGVTSWRPAPTATATMTALMPPVCTGLIDREAADQRGKGNRTATPRPDRRGASRIVQESSPSTAGMTRVGLRVVCNTLVDVLPKRAARNP